MQRVYKENEWGKVSKRIVTPPKLRIAYRPFPFYPLIEGDTSVLGGFCRQ